MNIQPIHGPCQRTWFAALALVLLFAPHVHGTKASAESAADQGYSDEDLDRSRSLIDAKLASRIAAIEKAVDNIESIQAEIKKDKIDFEKRATEEQKAFFLYLKSIGVEERQEMFRQFLDRQSRKRLAFDKSMLVRQKAWFQENIADAWKTTAIDLEPLDGDPAKSSAGHGKIETKTLPDAVGVKPQPPTHQKPRSKV
ncbi:MAG TPA: hypothetical protein DEB40_12620 [Elusimicrobia bacterium]|nr:hypothetical protein [Elusimicrobiota bacterium]HBT62577.1 hypothetical protein [Elusimicrobiota bacterium]